MKASSGSGLWPKRRTSVFLAVLVFGATEGGNVSVEGAVGKVHPGNAPDRTGGARRPLKRGDPYCGFFTVPATLGPLPGRRTLPPRADEVMAEEQPRELANLLRVTDPSSRESAWEKFLESYNRYILGTARFVAREYDGTMDCYRYVLEELRRDEFRRFRDYTARPTSRFSTWLVVVVRRLCHDFLRSRYGRVRADSGDGARERLETRRRLQNLIAAELIPADLQDRNRPTPEKELRVQELAEVLDSVLDGLSAEDRLLLKLRFEDGLPVRKIAEVMTFASEFVVYRRLKSLLMDLKERLEEAGVHDPQP